MEGCEFQFLHGCAATPEHLNESHDLNVLGLIIRRTESWVNINVEVLLIKYRV